MRLDQQIDLMKEDLIAVIQGCIQIKSVKDVEHAAPGAPFGPGIQDALEWTLALGEKFGFAVKNVEESGWADMDYYLKKEEVPQIGFAPDAEFPVIHAEKGILHLELSKSHRTTFPHLVSVKGGERPNIVPDLCEVIVKGIAEDIISKQLQDFSFPDGVSGELSSQGTEQGAKLTFKGVGAHGSLPQNGKNAILYALRFLQTLPLDSEEQHMLDFILTRPGTGFCGEGFGIALSDEPSGKLSLNLGILELTSEKVRFVIDIRYPVTFKRDDVFLPIEKIAQSEKISIKILTHQEPHHVPKDSALVQSLLKAYTEVTGLEPFAFAIGGGTYAKTLPQGVAFGPVFPGEPEVIHCPDEYISIENLLVTTKVYAQAILNLAADPENW